jgi:tripartite-type tricarboxylate transporter receptor subunit TctC
MKERSRALPNVPTFNEQGVSADLLTWTALFAPKGTPRDIVNRLNTVVNQVLKEPEVLAVFNRNALQAAGGTPEQLEAKLASEIVRWRTMIREAGLTAQ